MLGGKEADVYLTGEMSHVGPSTFTQGILIFIVLNFAILA